MPGNVAVLVDEMRRQRRAQLDSILGRASSGGGGGLAPMQQQPGRQHGDPKGNVALLAGGYNQLAKEFGLPSTSSLLSPLVGTAPQTLGAGFSTALSPSLAGGTFSSIPAGASLSAAPLTSGATTVGGTGALGAIGSGLSAAGSAIGGAASAVGGAAASGASSLVSLLASLL